PPALYLPPTTPYAKSARLHPVLLELAPQGRAGNAEAAGGLGVVALADVERPQDVVALELGQGLQGIGGLHGVLRWNRGGFASGRPLGGRSVGNLGHATLGSLARAGEVLGQVLEHDVVALAQRHRVLDDVLELADVAGVIVVEQERLGAFG